MTKRNIFIIITIICGLHACQLSDDSYIKEVPNTLESKKLLKTAIQQVAYNQSALGSRSAAAVMQYMTESESSIQYYRPYRLSSSFFDDMWSKGFYVGSLSSLRTVKEIATQEKNDDLRAITLVLLAHEFSTLTYMFGDIPFSEALQGETVLKPKYDSQKVVMEGIIKMLDEAINLIGDKSTNENLKDIDLIYRGDLQYWKKFAYGLKAKCIFNQRKHKINDDELLTLIEKSFTHRDEQAVFSFTEEFSNPLYLFEKQRRGTLLPSDHFVQQLLSTEDPRKFRFITKENDNSWIFSVANFFTNWFRHDEDMPLLSYTELLFMKAEATYHTGASNAKISTLLHDAISSSMRDNNVGLAGATPSFIEIYSDVNELSDKATLQRIIEQAYVAYHGFNYIQGWNNYRRTGYPQLLSTALFASKYNPSNVIPRRFLYPESERIYNTANVQKATERQGSDLLDQDMWLYR